MLNPMKSTILTVVCAVSLAVIAGCASRTKEETPPPAADENEWTMDRVSAAKDQCLTQLDSDTKLALGGTADNSKTYCNCAVIHIGTKIGYQAYAGMGSNDIKTMLVQDGAHASCLEKSAPKVSSPTPTPENPTPTPKPEIGRDPTLDEQILKGNGFWSADNLWDFQDNCTAEMEKNQGNTGLTQTDQYYRFCRCIGLALSERGTYTEISKQPPEKYREEFETDGTGANCIARSK